MNPLDEMNTTRKFVISPRETHFLVDHSFRIKSFIQWEMRNSPIHCLRSWPPSNVDVSNYWLEQVYDFLWPPEPEFESTQLVSYDKIGNPVIHLANPIGPPTANQFPDYNVRFSMTTWAIYETLEFRPVKERGLISEWLSRVLWGAIDRKPNVNTIWKMTRSLASQAFSQPGRDVVDKMRNCEVIIIPTFICSWLHWTWETWIRVERQSEYVLERKHSIKWEVFSMARNGKERRTIKKRRGR